MAKKFDLTDYKKITNKLIKVEDEGVYIFRLPIGASTAELVKTWKTIEQKPNVKILFVSHETEVYQKKTNLKNSKKY